MRKALLIVAMLLLVTPVMAATTITAVQGTMVRTPDGNQYVPISITYSGDVNVRAFALDINIDSNNGSPNFQRIRDFNVGEANGAVTGGKSGYGIFPSRFRDFIVVTSPNWVDPNYNPTTAWDEPETTDHNSGMGYPKMIVEMGTLYSGEANRPARSGTLFRFDVNSWGQVGTFTITIKANALRGGVVGDDGNPITPLTLTGTSVTFTKLVTDCFPIGDPNYGQWSSVGKPASWCGSNWRQCHGDATNSTEVIGKSTYWVGFNDLTVLIAGFQKAYTNPTLHPWIAADFSHTQETIGKSNYRVGFNDLNILITYFQKATVPNNCPHN